MSKSRERPFLREEWRELNAAQLVFIAAATVSGIFSVFGGLLVMLSVLVGVDSTLPVGTMQTAALPPFVGLILALCAVIFTRSNPTRRAAWQECSPAVLMSLAGLLGVVIAWLVN